LGARSPYGLESAPMHEQLKDKLDTLQLKGLRKILKFKASYIDRTNNQDRVYQIASARMLMEKETAAKKKRGKLKKEERGWMLGKKIKIKEVRRYSRIYEERKQKALTKIVNLEEGNPSKSVTFKKGTLIPLDVTEREGTKRRSGKPRVKWVETGLGNLWKLVGEGNSDYKWSIYDQNNEGHVKEMKRVAAIKNIHLKIKGREVETLAQREERIRKMVYVPAH